MQYDLPLPPDAEGEEPHTPSPPCAPDPVREPAGWLTGRPWQAGEIPAVETIDRLRREVPLMEPVSERLRNLLACRGLTSRRDL